MPKILPLGEKESVRQIVCGLSSGCNFLFSHFRAGQSYWQIHRQATHRLLKMPLSEQLLPPEGTAVAKVELPTSTAAAIINPTIRFPESIL